MKDPKLVKHKPSKVWTQAHVGQLCQSIHGRAQRQRTPTPPLYTSIRTQLTEEAALPRTSLDAFVSSSIVLDDKPTIPSPVIQRRPLTGQQASKHQAKADRISPLLTRKTEQIREQWVKSMGFQFAQKYNRSLNLRPGIYLSDQNIKEGMETVYGRGENKRLRPGEEALILKTIK